MVLGDQRDVVDIWLRGLRAKADATVAAQKQK